MLLEQQMSDLHRARFGGKLLLHAPARRIGSSVRLLLVDEAETNENPQPIRLRGEKGVPASE